MSASRVSREKGENVLVPVRGIDWSCLKCARSGIIPYCIVQGQLYFILGLDSVFPTLSDFSGGQKDGELMWQAAIREFREESLGVFGIPSLQELQSELAIINNDSMTIFYQIEVDDLDNLEQRFASKVTRKSEMTKLKILDAKLMIKAVIHNRPHIFIRVRELLFDHIEELVKILTEKIRD